MHDQSWSWTPVPGLTERDKVNNEICVVQFPSGRTYVRNTRNALVKSLVVMEPGGNVKVLHEADGMLKSDIRELVDTAEELWEH